MKKTIYVLACLLMMAGPVAIAQVDSGKEVATLELAAKREAIKKEVLAGYMALKQSLIVSDSLNSAKDATKFIRALEQFKFKKLTLPEMNAATILRKEVKELALEISGTSNITKQRKVFAVLSVKMWDMAAKLKPMGTPIYQQVCPMTGETWLSMDKEIKNPYYPKNMLTCGEVRQSI
ncbi:DUF3347 domain-containing protein [Pedobacter sp. GR22-6]|uniref:DUF3347 domain-containing protein n=1 Tax=Pedobacter sp. GR22-6 TaxID=3127957 RepID=UPI00307F5B31